MSILINLLVSGLAVFVTAYILPGVMIDGFLTALIVAVVMGVVNMFIKPIIQIISLPITVVTLGLFSFIINVLLIMFVDFLVTGFTIDGFLWALVFGVVLWMVQVVLNTVIGSK